MDTSDLISSAAASPAKRIWRRHDDAFKARVIELARQPHTSVAAVAPSHRPGATKPPGGECQHAAALGARS